MDEIKLKPCPFCGSDILYFVVDNNTDTVGIFCNWCKQTTTFEENEWEGDTTSAKTRAADAWNMRADAWNRRVNDG